MIVVVMELVTSMETFAHAMMDGMLPIVVVVSIVIVIYEIIVFNGLLVGQCPMGVAWVDKAFAVDEAHQSVQCSNAGTCINGACLCYPGFTGEACQRGMINQEN